VEVIVLGGWDVIDKSDGFGASRLEKTAGFTLVSFKPETPRPFLDSGQAQAYKTVVIGSSDDIARCLNDQPLV
jgi:hypothetical protein